MRSHLLLAPLLLIATACASDPPRPVGALAPATTLLVQVEHEVIVDVPEGAALVTLQMALPQRDDPFQRVHDLRVISTHPHTTVRDDLGNELLLLVAEEPEPGKLRVSVQFAVERASVRFDLAAAEPRLVTDAELKRLSAYGEYESGLGAGLTVGGISYSGPQRESPWVREDGTALPARETAEAMLSLYNDPERTAGLALTPGDIAQSMWPNRVPARVVRGVRLHPEIEQRGGAAAPTTWLEVWLPGLDWVPVELTAAGAVMASLDATRFSVGVSAAWTEVAQPQRPLATATVRLENTETDIPVDANSKLTYRSLKPLDLEPPAALER